MKNSNQFNIFSWSSTVPLCDNLWLGMQARNIAIVDFTLIRGIEASALEAYIERERTPTDILITLSALSQMWVFALYEFLRTWRQRANEIIEIEKKYALLEPSLRQPYLDNEVKKARKKEGSTLSPQYYARHIAQVSDHKFVGQLKLYFEQTDALFREAEALRVTLAKHEVPKTSGLIAEAPGYGRMSYRDGSMYWFVTLKDGSQFSVNRRELSNTFFVLDDDEL